MWSKVADILKPAPVGSGGRSSKAVTGRLCDWTGIVLEYSVLGAFFGVAWFLQAVGGVAATIGKILGILFFIVFLGTSKSLHDECGSRRATVAILILGTVTMFIYKILIHLIAS